MNPSDWIKVAALVPQHKQEAATIETDQLSSMPLSQITMDNSGPPVVHYGTHVPTVTNTLTGTDVHVYSSHQEDPYQQIISGIPQVSLYSTLSSLSSEAVASQEEVQSLRDKVSKGLEKYLQDAEQRHALELNYFDDSTTCMSEEPILEDAEWTTQSSKSNPFSAKQMSIEDIDVTRNAPESLKSDTGPTSGQPSQVRTDAEEKYQQIMTLKDAEQDTDAQHGDGKHSVEDVTREPTPRHSEQPHTTLTCTNEVITPTKKVGCTLVTNY